MTKRCVAQGCNSEPKVNVSLHKFPGDPRRRKQWEAFVLSHRRNWRSTPHSYLCSLHFLPSDYIDNDVRKSLGYQGQNRLKHDAVPTVNAVLAIESSKPEPQKRTAFLKREKQRTLENIWKESYVNQEQAQENPVASNENKQDKPTALVIKQRNVKIQARVLGKSKACQVNVVKSEDKSTQCDLANSGLRKIKTPTPEKEEYPPEPNPDSDDDHSDTSDETYIPFDTDTSQSEENPNTSDDDKWDQPYQPLHKERKFIVFESALLQLFTICFSCFSKVQYPVIKLLGSYVSIMQTCQNCGKRFHWGSQPMIENIPSGNILLSASILFTGALPSKVLRVLSSCGVATMSLSTYYRHQKKFLLRTISNVWKEEETKLTQNLRKKPLILGGDGRNDSMGHSAKYGSYTLMELEKNKILDVQLVQCNEVKGSCHMELEGFKRCIDKITKMKMKIKVIVTDMHTMIQKYIRESMATVTHYFDVWHVAKGLKKKLVSLSKKKGCELVGKWIKSITNHLYWVAKTSNGNGKLATAKWDSLMGHVQNIYKKHPSKLFPKCTHKKLQRKWFKPGAKDTVMLSDIMESSRLRKRVAKLSPLGQTSSFKGYHSIVNHFCPKMVHFSYNVMDARLKLAALHYNENAGRPIAKNKQGKEEYTIKFPKAKKGDHIVAFIPSPYTYAYVDRAMEELFSLLGREGDEQQLHNVVPEPMCSKMVKPVKEEAVKYVMSRF